ncbi:MAG: type II toxin-antitoxin system Phd/YefM family antitoxin [Bauldia sp.]|nr:type II toxin-antitoxin system Phd/YefM family antitoxin [Bauldia sp.]
MQYLSAREAKNGFGRSIDLALAEPATNEKHGRAVVVVVAVEECERLAGREGAKAKTATGGIRKPKRAK